VQPETRNSKLEPAEVARRARLIKLLLMDCDGVMTDGRLTLMSDGDEQKTFHVWDGQGITLFHRAGLKTGVISGRTSSATERRARELNMTYLRQGATNKLAAFEELVSEAGVSANECAYIGDDLADIAIMRRVGLAVAVANAAEETKQAAHFITRQSGGDGAVREVVQLILKLQGSWDEIMKGLID
jgi:3-deoxy-D-manno-octulosonate 8-phosphate phosphatase (KDO 8-P phosphatase)